MNGEDQAVRSSFSVNEVLGAVDTEELQLVLQEHCNAILTTVDASSMWATSHASLNCRNNQASLFPY